MDTKRTFGEGDNDEGETTPESAPRARNRTVMLTPEMTGQVRARLQQDAEASAPVETAGRREDGGPGSPESSATFSSLSGSKSRSGTGTFAAAGIEAKSQRPPSPVMVPPPPPPALQSNTPSVAKAPLTPAVVWQKVTPLVAFLVSYDRDPNGEIFELRSGRLIVTSAPVQGGNYLLIVSDTVSPMHAILRITERGEIQVLDQLSEFGTAVQRFGSDDWHELSGDKCALDHGDILRFGKREFYVCVVPVRSE